MAELSEEIGFRNHIAVLVKDVRAPIERRRQIMTELLEYMRSDYTSVKIAAADMMSYFFEKLPDMHERAIDAVYDLCEDAEEEVRSLGYKMVCQTAKREHAWTARNADVLVQLLQNEDPSELEVIRNSLKDLLASDPDGAFPVLYDYMNTNNDATHSLDLRGHVLEFLTDYAGIEVLESLSTRPQLLELFAEGLLRSLKSSTLYETVAIVDKLLYPMVEQLELTQLSQQAVQAILNKTMIALSDEQRRPESRTALPSTIQYVEEAGAIASLPASDLQTVTSIVDFITSNLLPAQIFTHLIPDKQLEISRFVIVLYGTCITKFQSTTGLDQLDPARDALAKHFGVLSKTLLKVCESDPDSWQLISRLTFEIAKPSWAKNNGHRQNEQHLIAIRSAAEKRSSRAPSTILVSLKNLLGESSRPIPTHPSSGAAAHGRASPMSPEPSSSASLPQNPAKRKADSLASRLSPVAVISNSAPAAETGDKNALFARLGEPLPSPALSWAATTSDPPQQRAGKRARTEPTSLLKRLSVNATGQSSDALISRNGDGTDASLLAATPMHGGSKISPRSDSPNDARNKRSIPLMGSTLASGEGNGAGLPIKRAKANSANPPPAVSIRNAAMTKSTSQNPPKVAAAESPRAISPTTSTAGLGSFSILGAAKKNRGTTPTTIQPHPQLRPPPVKAGPGSLGDARSVTESSSAVPALAKRLHMMNARVGEGVAGRRKRGGIVPRGSDQRMR